MAKPIEKRMLSALSNYANQLVFMTGGFEAPPTTQYYNISLNSWAMGPSISKARNSHSSCTLGSRVYIFGGLDENFTAMG